MKFHFSKQYRYVTNHLLCILPITIFFVFRIILLVLTMYLTIINDNISVDNIYTYCSILPNKLRSFGPIFQVYHCDGSDLCKNWGYLMKWPVIVGLMHKWPVIVGLMFNSLIKWYWVNTYTDLVLVSRLAFCLHNYKGIINGVISSTGLITSASSIWFNCCLNSAGRWIRIDQSGILLSGIVGSKFIWYCLPGNFPSTSVT